MFTSIFAKTIALATAIAFASALPTTTLEERQACADVIVVFARGTTEPSPIGTIVGPPLQSALQAALAGRGMSLSFQGVNYPASIAGFLEGGDPQGSATMAADLTNAANSCPNAKIISSGYSQGGQLVHNSAQQLSSTVKSRINAVVIFGDPDNGEAVSGISSSRVDVICHIGDDICAHGDEILLPHLTYGQDTPAAAQFIVSHL
ncbi:hypothetical protein D9758_004593 [Tetrapyrgos nigripes]|uniref:Cutinase n=1 Tax=Tetrapyrgos nigripes TaxID=182062 RepID=A0A8H5GZN7_9AGAR|nr:hypothetical protein D9758_004593 [Tetrapyrgos nigripes]